MRTSLKYILCVVAAVLWSSVALAAEGNVVSISEDLDELELYTSPGADDPAATIAAEAVKFPLPILAVSKNGMFKVAIKDGEYWIIGIDVVSDLLRKVDASCDPEMAGTVVVHGKRGAGEGCQ